MRTSLSWVSICAQVPPGDLTAVTAARYEDCGMTTMSTVQAVTSSTSDEAELRARAEMPVDSSRKRVMKTVVPSRKKA